MSIEVHRKLRLVPVERKQPQRVLTVRRILRRPQPRHIVAHLKEEPPCPPR